MSQKAYKFWRIRRWTEAWTQMPLEERDRIFGEMTKNLEDVGGKWILRCTCSWANEEYRAWGINEYPSLEAAVKDGENLAGWIGRAMSSPNRCWGCLTRKASCLSPPSLAQWRVQAQCSPVSGGEAFCRLTRVA